MVAVGKIFRLFTIFCEHLLPLVIRVTRGLRNVDKCQLSQRTYDMNIDYAVLHCLTPATPLFLFVHIFLAERLHIRQLSFVFSLSLDRIPRLAFKFRTALVLVYLICYRNIVSPRSRVTVIVSVLFCHDLIPSHLSTPHCVLLFSLG